MKLFEVEISRIHKGSPYNCVGYLNEVQCENENSVIDLPKVDDLINKTYGKKLIVTISQKGQVPYLQYEILKSKAIL